jgi:hypothetical protein
MNEKLKELRNKCTEKEAKFLELWVNGEEKFNAYNNAGFKAKNTKVASAAICRLLKKVNCSAYLEALKNQKDSELQRKNKITRTTQLNALEDAKKLAEKLNNPSAMVSAIREQNEMLGYHRENAPNTEKEAMRRKIEDDERKELEKAAKERSEELSKKRTEELSQTGLKVVKLPSA